MSERDVVSVRYSLSRVFDGMAKGLFASLIVGVIIKQIGIYIDLPVLVQIGQMAQYMMGPCIGAGIALVLECRHYTLLAALTAGALGAGSVSFTDGGALIRVGEPVGALIASWLAIEGGRRLEGHTKFDLLLVPGFMIVIGGIIGFTIAPVLALFLNQIGLFINECTLLQPLPMGILLSVTVGILLTLPISSAALCIAIGISGLAAGAALAGCCAQMVGFAVMSFRDNRLSGVLAVGLGTSMLQFPNIIKNPWIWLPPTLASVISGPLSTMFFHMETSSVGAGMGTSGLVGPLTTLSVMGFQALLPILVLQFLLPALLTFAIAEYMRKLNLIHEGDLKI